MHGQSVYTCYWDDLTTSESQRGSKAEKSDVLKSRSTNTREIIKLEKEMPLA